MRYQQHPLNERTDNCIRAFTFQHPRWIPCAIGCLPATWLKYGRELEKIHLEHSRLHPAFKEGDGDPATVRRNLHSMFRVGTTKDNWGCLHETLIEGICAEVKEFPLTARCSRLQHRSKSKTTSGSASIRCIYRRAA